MTIEEKKIVLNVYCQTQANCENCVFDTEHCNFCHNVIEQRFSELVSALPQCDAEVLKELRRDIAISIGFHASEIEYLNTLNKIANGEEV